jgi:hypothetical protein
LTRVIIIKRGANAEWRCDQEKRGTRVKKAEKEEDKNGSKSSTKKRQWKMRIY